MIGETWTWTRPNTSVEWWDDYGIRTNNTQIRDLSNYFENFLNTIIDTNSGESWSLSETDTFTKTFVMSFANYENYNQFQQNWQTDEKLVEFARLIDLYNSEVGITETQERP
jgi:hypothetical protein